MLKKNKKIAQIKATYRKEWVKAESSGCERVLREFLDKEVFESNKLNNFTMYYDFLLSYIDNKSKKYYNAFIDYINIQDVNESQIVLINNVLKKINYVLINILPNLIKHNLNPKRVYCKHWNLAQEHNKLLDS